MAVESQNRLALPAGIRVAWTDDDAGAVPLRLPVRRQLWVARLIVAAAFAIFAGVGWTMLGRIWGSSVRNVFDLMFLLFEGFWLLGWSVAVAILGGLTALLFFGRETARLQGTRLVYAPRFGPLKIIVPYELARVRNVRAEGANGSDLVRVRFDYDEGIRGIGDYMPMADADRVVHRIQSAADAARSGIDVPFAPPPPAKMLPRPVPPPAAPPTVLDEAPPSLMSRSGLALIAANLVPLAGVLFFGWDLAGVMVLFWAESAVIGFYTALKMAVAGKYLAILMVPFFIGHYGGFMAGHFLLIYSFFVRGAAAAGPGPPVKEALLAIFSPLRLSLAGLFISHGVSFFDNFIGRREYERTTMNRLMVAPYNRIVVMHLALIFGGWIIILLKAPVGALALLVLFKTVLDFTAHKKEHSS